MAPTLCSGRTVCPHGREQQLRAPPTQWNLPSHAYLVEVFACGSHLLPGFVQQLDADAEEFLEGAIVREEHGMEVVAVFTGCGKSRERHVIMLFIMCKAPAYATDRRPLGTDSDFHPPGVYVETRWLKDPLFGPFTFCFSHS